MQNSNNIKKNIFICTGGSGGHVFPAIALYQNMKQKYNVLIITDARGNKFIESSKSVNKNDTVILPTISTNPKKIVSTAYNCIKIFMLVIRLMKMKKPIFAIGLGSICTIIPLICSKLIKAKVIIHEQNAVIGKANNLLYYIADYFCVGFSELAKQNSSYIHLQTPVRKEFLVEKHIYNPKNDQIKIFVMGGSQGAKIFDMIIPEIVAKLKRKYKLEICITQHTNTSNIENLKKFYKKNNITCEIADFFHDVHKKLINTDIVICRAGASTISEIATLGICPIFVPYPSAAQDHQMKNAIYVKNITNAPVINELESNSKEQLYKTIATFIENPETIKLISKNMLMLSSKDSISKILSLIK